VGPKKLVDEEVKRGNFTLEMTGIGVWVERSPFMTLVRPVRILPAPWAIAQGLGDVGLAVLVGWLVLATTGSWSAESSWLDRTGLFLGAAWVGIFLIHRLVLYTMNT
jgi:hypothetical protein